MRDRIAAASPLTSPSQEAQIATVPSTSGAGSGSSKGPVHKGPDRDVPDTTRGAGEVVDVVQRGDRGLTAGTMGGPPTALTCPQCGGAIWEQAEGHLIHFRCHVGHRFTADAFASEQASNLEATLWAALRMFEEKVLLHRRMARTAEQSQNHYLALRFQERAEESARQTEVIRRLLLGEPQEGGWAGPPAFDTPASGLNPGLPTPRRKGVN
jgi:hypothetical protein